VTRPEPARDTTAWGQGLGCGGQQVHWTPEWGSRGQWGSEMRRHWNRGPGGSTEIDANGARGACRMGTRQ
jgi:hypothetical protein